MVKPMKKNILWILIFISGFFLAKLTSNQIVIFTSKSYQLSAQDYIGKYDFIKFFPKKSFWINRIDYEVIGGGRETIHHVILENLSKQDYTCPNVFRERIHANGREISPLVLPAGYGYPLDKRDGIAVINHLVNPSSNKLDDVKIQFTFTVKPKNFLTKMIDVQPIWLDVRNCTNDPTFFVPPKTQQTFTIEPKIYAPHDGEIVYVGGHLHNYGKKITLQVADTKYEILPEPNFTNINKVPHYTFHQNLQQVKKGDLMDMHVDYDNISESEIDGMGIGMMYLSK